jgi:hypothetical protein
MRMDPVLYSWEVDGSGLQITKCLGRVWTIPDNDFPKWDFLNEGTILPVYQPSDEFMMQMMA